MNNEEINEVFERRERHRSMKTIQAGMEELLKIRLDILESTAGSQSNADMYVLSTAADYILARSMVLGIKPLLDIDVTKHDERYLSILQQRSPGGRR